MRDRAYGSALADGLSIGTGTSLTGILHRPFPISRVEAGQYRCKQEFVAPETYIYD